MVGFDLADFKRQARLALHSVMAVSAFYSDDTTPSTPVTVRWHNKIVRNGAMDSAMSAEIVEGIDRLVFQQSELTSLGIFVGRTGVVTIPQYDAAFTLAAEEQSDGPENVYFSVSRVIPE